ncbi:MAG TPA: ATP-grasp domain-containing protein [Gemmataceae bacterium]|nr:ATP-grasp domain-containing protein [Gemmataceae bacterium]
MRVFIYEFFCCNLSAHRFAEALAREGRAMFLAVLEDFSRIPKVEVVTMKTSGAPWKPVQGVHILNAADEETTFRELARSADFTLVIAPEVDDILFTRCQWVEESGSRLLGPSSSAVRLTGDKWLLAHQFRQQGIPTPKGILLDHGLDVADLVYPVVCKPRYGAGSLATFLIRNREEWPSCRQQMETEGFRGQSLIQPFVQGTAASIAFLQGPDACIPLQPAEQELSTDGRFHYRGGRLPLAGDLAERTIRLGQRALACVGELMGYIGVDIVLGNAPNGAYDYVMEINPRFTTSYLGLRALAQTNLAEALLQVFQGEASPKISWKKGLVHFQAEGTVNPVLSDLD